MAPGIEANQVYEVFARARYEDPLRHVGSVTAPDDELAQVYAKSVYDEWQWIEMIIVPRRAVIRVVQPA